jgi:hypothetical protein
MTGDQNPQQRVMPTLRMTERAIVELDSHVRLDLGGHIGIQGRLRTTFDPD